MATIYSQLCNLEGERGGRIAAALTWHVKALAIRLRLAVPQAIVNLRRLAAIVASWVPSRSPTCLLLAGSSKRHAPSLCRIRAQAACSQCQASMSY